MRLISAMTHCLTNISSKPSWVSATFRPGLWNPSTHFQTSIIYASGPVHTDAFSFQKTHTFGCVFGYRPHYNAERFHRKRIHLKTLSRVETFENEAKRLASFIPQCPTVPVMPKGYTESWRKLKLTNIINIICCVCSVMFDTVVAIASLLL